MAARDPEPLLAALVAGQARLLRAESDDPRALSLRFDRGVLRAALVDGALELELGGATPLAEDAAILDEDDPWWTVLGHPLCGAWSRRDGEGRRQALELQLRPDGENPKIVVLEARGMLLRAVGVAKSLWAGAQ
jgi:hypothetical protein